MENPFPSDGDSDSDALEDIILIGAYLYGRRNEVGRRIHTSTYTGLMWIDDILNGHQARCQRQFRMKRLCFLSLCDRLERCGLTTSENVTVREAVGIFLWTIATANSNRQVAERYQR